MSDDVRRDPLKPPARRRGPKPKLTGQALEEVQRRRRDGESIRTISAAMGASRSAVARALKQLDSPATPPLEPLSRRVRQDLVRRGVLPEPSRFRCRDCTARAYLHFVTRRPGAGIQAAAVCPKCYRALNQNNLRQDPGQQQQAPALPGGQVAAGPQ